MQPEKADVPLAPIRKSIQDKFLGNYERHPIENGLVVSNFHFCSIHDVTSKPLQSFHKAFIYEKNGNLFWRNFAQEKWRLTIENGLLSAIASDSTSQSGFKLNFIFLVIKVQPNVWTERKALQYEMNNDRDISSVIFNGEVFKHTERLAKEGWVNCLILYKLYNRIPKQIKIESAFFIQSWKSTVCW